MSVPDKNCRRGKGPNSVFFLHVSQETDKKERGPPCTSSLLLCTINVSGIRLLDYLLQFQKNHEILIASISSYCQKPVQKNLKLHLACCRQAWIHTCIVHFTKSNFFSKIDGYRRKGILKCSIHSIVCIGNSAHLQWNVWSGALQ